MIVSKGSLNVTVPVEIQNSTTGLHETGVAHTSLTAYYVRERGAATAITLSALSSATDAHSDGGWFEIDATNMEGVYRLDVPDAAFAAGASHVTISVEGTGFHVEAVRVDLQDLSQISATGAVAVDTAGLDQYSLCSIADLKLHLNLQDSDASLRTDSFTVYFGGAGATGTVEVTATTLVLTDDATTTTLTLSDAANDTITELVAAINAVTGWVAEVVGDGNSASTDLPILASVSALAVGNIQTIRIVNNTKLALVINGASGAIEKFTGRNFAARDYKEWYDARDGLTGLHLRWFPIIEVKQLAVGEQQALYVTNTGSVTDATIEVTGTSAVCRHWTGGAEVENIFLFTSYATITALAAAINAIGTGWTATVQGSLGDYPSSDVKQSPGRRVVNSSVYLELPNYGTSDIEFGEMHDTAHSYGEGILFRLAGEWDTLAGFGGGRRAVWVNYRAGYETIPWAIRIVACQLAAMMWHESAKDLTLSSEKLGDYQYVIARGLSNRDTPLRDRLERFMQDYMELLV